MRNLWKKTSRIINSFKNTLEWMHENIDLGGKIKQILRVSFLFNSVYLILTIFGNTKASFNVNLEFLYNWDYPPSKVLKSWEVT